MFAKILKKDLKRKKAMNIVLFLFMITASMLIASSVNLLYTSTTALEHFKEQSKTSDNIFITLYDSENDRMMEEWIDKYNKIKEVNTEDMILVMADKITLLSQDKKIEDETTLSVAKVPKKDNLIFSEQDEKVELNPGEVAIPKVIKDNANLKIGDKIKIRIGNLEKEFVVKNYIKDVLFGSGMMGFKRFIISDEDYEEYNKVSEKNILKLWGITKAETATYDDIEKDFSKTSIASLFTFNNEVVSFGYLMDLVSAAIMSIVSIFLILIAFLILRFTIRFTIEEDFKEIGIMKAIGLKNLGIKKIYLVKYSALSLFGGGIGFAVSIPFSGYLLSNLSENIMITTSVLNYSLAALSSVFIMFVTILFCYLCTGRINKLTAIDAIRQGSTGERFSVSRKLKLHNVMHISTPVYMAIGDLLGGFKRFLILVVTFILGTVIIIVPINNINTLLSDDINTLFGLGSSDFSISAESLGNTYRNSSVEELLADTTTTKLKIKEKGFDVNLHLEIMCMTKIHAGDPNVSRNILGLQGYDYSTGNYTYLEGTPPELENEAAITKKVADYFGIGWGDSIYRIDKDGTEKFIVTALYQSMNNLGFSVRFSDKHLMKIDNRYGITLFGEFKDGNSEQLIELKNQFPELGIKSAREYMDYLMGNILGQLGSLKNIIIIVVLGINFLIATLIVRMHITKEIPEIALLKSIGFKDREIRKWQAVRIMLILIKSIIFGTIIANLTGSYISSGIFNLMGATNIKLKIEPVQVYLIYPAIILTVTMLSVLVSLGQVRRTRIWEINNQE